MPEEATTAQASQDTSAGDGKNTGEAKAGAVTETAKTTSQAAQVDITETPEFKAALTAAVEKKLPQLRRQIGKELSGEKEGQASVEDLQRERDEARNEARTLKAKDDLFDYVDDGGKKVGLRADSRRAFWRIAQSLIEFDDDGKPSNISDVVKAVKSEAPALFTSSTGSVDAGAHSNGAAPNDINSFIRRAAGRN